jgi:hypothetical protein
MRRRALPALLAITVGASPACTRLLAPYDEGGPWSTVEREHLTIHFHPGSLAARDIETIGDEQEASYARAVSELEVGFDGVITLYLYDAAEAGRIGFAGGHGGFADPFTQTVREVYSGRVLGAHELVHVIAEQSFGRGHTRLMSEGLAVAISGWYGGRPLYEWRADTVPGGGLAAIGELLDNEDGYPEAYFYPQAGSFVRFLLDSGSPARIAAIYPPDQTDLRRVFRTVFGLSLDEVEGEYRAALGAP